MPPDAQAMGTEIARSTAATILFADVAGSTRLYEKIGDAKALEAIGRCLRELSSVAARFEGRVIKTLGDEIMVAFPAPEGALGAATEMQIERRARNDASEARLEIRAGFHHGDVLERDGDLFGDTVNVAARMARLARTGQILTTGQTVERLPGYARSVVRLIDTLPIKGRQEALAVCEVVWHWGEGLTMLDVRESAVDVSAKELVLEHSRGSFRMHAGLGGLVLGRDSSADIVLAHLKASRSHARIERRRDKFVLADTSTNGTFVHFDGDRELLLRREEIALRGAGAISCGASTASADAELIRFRIE
jgi:adenylate cyclase